MGIGDLAFFKDLALFLSRFSYRTQLYTPFFNEAWEHYAFASIGNGSVLQRDCSHGFLAGFAPTCLRMGCWSESCSLHHLEQLCLTLQTFKQLHDNQLTHYNCTEFAPPLVADAPAPDAPAQGRDDDSACPLSLPPLNLLASLRVRQDEDNGEAAARPSFPPQRQVTKHIMQTWTLHEQVLRNPTTDRMHAVHMLHQTQSVPMLDENSALRDNMPQCNDEVGGKKPRLDDDVFCLFLKKQKSAQSYIPQGYLPPYEAV